MISKLLDILKGLGFISLAVGIILLSEKIDNTKKEINKEVQQKLYVMSDKSNVNTDDSTILDIKHSNAVTDDFNKIKEEQKNLKESLLTFQKDNAVKKDYTSDLTNINKALKDVLEDNKDLKSKLESTAKETSNSIKEINDNNKKIQKEQENIISKFEQINVKLSGQANDYLDLKKILDAKLNEDKVIEEIKKIENKTPVVSPIPTNIVEPVKEAPKTIEEAKTNLADLPFTLYKIQSNEKFYIADAKTGTLYAESAIYLDTIISGRYAVIKIDYENKFVEFKDMKTKATFKLKG